MSISVNSNNVNGNSNVTIIAVMLTTEYRIQRRKLSPCTPLMALQLARFESCSSTHVQYSDLSLNCNDSDALNNVTTLNLPWSHIYLLEDRCKDFISTSCEERVFALNYDKWHSKFDSQYLPATLLSFDGHLAVVRYDALQREETIPAYAASGNIEIPSIVSTTCALNTCFYKQWMQKISKPNRKRNVADFMENDFFDDRHNFNQYNNSANVNKKRKLNDDSVDNDIEILSTPFVSHMSYEEAICLKIGDRFDHRDKFGRVFAAKVAEINGTNIRVSYEGWPSKWDIWSDISTELWKFSTYGSISKRPKHRFLDKDVGDFIDIYAKYMAVDEGGHCYNKRWKYAEIKQFDADSGQIQVILQFDSNSKLVYWVHLDDVTEVAVFGTKSNLYGDEEQARIMNEIYFNKQNKENETEEEEDKKKKQSTDSVSEESDNDDVGVKKKNANDDKQLKQVIDIHKWDSNDIYQWIMMLDGGRFSKYKELQQVLNEEELSGNDLIYFSEQDIKDFGIRKFGDRKFLWKKIQEILPPKPKKTEHKAEYDEDDDIPQQYLDPITYEIMKDPVLCTKSGQTYDRKTILDWIAKKGTDPITRQNIKEKHLVSNRTLKELIEEWTKKH